MVLFCVRAIVDLNGEPAVELFRKLFGFSSSADHFAAAV